MSEIDTANRYMVGVKGDSVVVLLPPTTVLTRVAALTLAAWLVANADTIRWDPAVDPSFEEVRRAVENT